jgi:pyruvate formate lyase activating enzyme
MRSSGIIFDIKKFAVHDGPGIRTTVFLKGCPLRCAWCHNPEGIAAGPGIMVFAGRCIKGCRDCLAACPRGALKKVRGIILLDRGLCDRCGACVEACPAEALRSAGRTVPVCEIMEEVGRDIPFYRESGGGVTFSGGEPLSQPAFLRELLLACRARGIHAAVDTSGHAPFSLFAELLPMVDLFLYDLKIIDDERHRRFTGVSNRLILENLEKLSRAGAPLAVRVPLIPGVNDADVDLEAMAAFCAALPGRHPLHLLPYHRGYAAKRRRLGLDAVLPAIAPPSSELLERAGKIFAGNVSTVIIGG